MSKSSMGKITSASIDPGLTCEMYVVVYTLESSRILQRDREIVLTSEWHRFDRIYYFKYNIGNALTCELSSYPGENISQKLSSI